MEKSNLSGYLDVVMSNQDVVNGKPDPEIYLKTITKLGLKPNECLVVEDNDNGIRAARAAGASLMIVSSIYDVSLENILQAIQQQEAIEA